MKQELLDYDIFPKVFPCGQNIRICIKPLGDHVLFRDEYYTISVQGLNDGAIYDYPERENQIDYDIMPDEDGNIYFTHAFEDEQEYYINIFLKGRKIVRLSVYAVLCDLVGKYPFKGNLHTHSFRSGGKRSPAVEAALFRQRGFDFIAITDSHRYFPSLEAIHAYKNAPLEMSIISGEEIHMPKFPDAINDITIVNFGGTYSINALIDNSIHNKEVGDSKSYRSLDGSCPDTISSGQYYKEVCELEQDLFTPKGIEKFTYASCVWIFNHIKASDGLGIFCHPFWISDVCNVPHTLAGYITKNKPFDAFEVFGNENYFEQYGYQAAHYYDDRAAGIKYPVVGSSEYDCKKPSYTIVFSQDNEREEIIKSVKASYCTAVQGENESLNIAGDTRLVRYACFLINNFFPLHDELCFEEGRLMKAYINKDESALDLLKAIHGRMKKQREKYFKF